MRKLWTPSRRKLLLGGASLIASPAILRAQVPMTGAGLGKPATGGVPTLTFVTGVPAAVVNVANYDTGAVSFGSASSDRLVIVCISANFSSAPALSTIGGVAATLAGAVSGSYQYSAIWFANVPTGTTGHIVFTSGYIQTVGFSIYNITGATVGQTPVTATQAWGFHVPPTVGITVPGSGVGVVSMMTASDPTGGTWSGGVSSASDFSDAGTTAVAQSVSEVSTHMTLTGAITPAWSNNSGAGVIAAAWGP